MAYDTFLSWGVLLYDNNSFTFIAYSVNYSSNHKHKGAIYEKAYEFLDYYFTDNNNG